MYYISVCVTLLTILAGLHVWNKNKAQENSAIYKWLMYLVIGAAVLILICQISQGIMRMTCGDSCKPNKEMKMMKHHKMMRMHHGNGGACCGEMMDKEDCEKHGAGCEDDEDCGGKENENRESPNDSNTTSHE